MPKPPCRSEKAGRDKSLCGVNSKDPNRIEFPRFGDEEAGGDAGDVDEAADDMAEAADAGSCANRFPTDGANCRGYSPAMPSVWGLG